jgi:hypothetical protein
MTALTNEGIDYALQLLDNELDTETELFHKGDPETDIDDYADTVQKIRVESIFQRDESE